MPFELWGATEAPRLVLPPRPLVGYALLIVYLVAFVYTLYHYRVSFMRLTRRQWLAVFLLSLASLSVSQLFPISLALDSQLPPPGAAQNPQAILALFGAVPFLLAGAALNPGAALVVGLFSGLGRALWRTHQLYDPFTFAFAALLAAWWLQQVYRGRFYRVLRHPIVSGALSLVLLLPAVFLASFVYTETEVSGLVTMDWAISMALAQLLPFLIEGAFSGAVVALILVGVPQWRARPDTLVAAPQERSVRNRLLLNFAIFAVLLSSVLLAVVFTLSVRVATQLSVNQMAHDAEAVSQQIPAFRNQMQNLLSQYGDDPALVEGDAAEAEARLAQLVHTAGAFYRRVVLVGEDGSVVAFYPNRDTDEITLTLQEENAVADALDRGAPSISAAQRDEGREHVLSFVVPVRDEEGEPVAALVGRVPGVALNGLIVGLQGTVGEGSGFVVDEQNRVIAHPDETSLLTAWAPPATREPTLQAKVDAPGTAFAGRESETNARELLYVLEGPDHPWKVVITVPYQVVLRLALQISAPLLAVLSVAIVLFSLNLVYLGRSITTPLEKLVQASQQLASGQWDAPVPAQGEDEVGKLGQAFERMRRSMQRQFSDMRLMLGVSQDISASIDIEQGLPTILRGALRGTGASGARAVVVNPSGRHPLTFAEGPAGEAMAVFDRRVTLLARRQDEVSLSTGQEVRSKLGLREGQEIPVHSLLALALQAKGRFQGVLWLGYRQEQAVTATELNLLRTMAGQASVLVENARLFATAEGQRRRLAAVLASTSDAVIVTDQTNRILLVNRAMERTFRLRASDVIGRPVADVIRNRHLVKALTEREERVRNLEIPVGAKRTLYAGVSTIISKSGQVLGRVAVLHDITHLKQLDKMKSEFVATVSHDLRSPLTFIRGYVTMLPMMGEVNEKQEEYIRRILSGLKQMTNLVEDLLDLGRIEAGVELQRDKIDPAELLAHVAQEQTSHAAMQGLQLQVQARPTMPTLEGDALLIRRAVANLVSNAIKYAPHSGTVTLRAEADKQEVVFSVQDRGPGIPRKDQIRLFEKFYRIQKEGRERRDTKGSGLGLAIVKSIVERHGGRVWCHSEEGKGSTFYFSLPLNGQGKEGADQAR